jgi:hypothetical protein
MRRLQRQPYTVVRENPAPEPTISTSRILVIQRMPEERLIDLRNFHIIRLLIHRSQGFFG